MAEYTMIVRNLLKFYLLLFVIVPWNILNIWGINIYLKHSLFELVMHYCLLPAHETWIVKRRYHFGYQICKATCMSFFQPLWTWSIWSQIFCKMKVHCIIVAKLWLLKLSVHIIIQIGEPYGYHALWFPSSFWHKQKFSSILSNI